MRKLKFVAMTALVGVLVQLSPQAAADVFTHYQDLWGLAPILSVNGTNTSVTDEVTLISNSTAANTSELTPEVINFAINNGDFSTMPLAVALNNTATNAPIEYMASETSNFEGASWVSYSIAPVFALSYGVGVRTVHFKVRNAYGESSVVRDTIFIVPNMVPVASDTFMMGRIDTGDDTDHGLPNEDPQHQVALSAYQFGTYEVTNKEYCDVLNWALSQGYLKTSSGAAWSGKGDIYAGDGNGPYLIVAISQRSCDIEYAGEVFVPKTRVGLPDRTSYSMSRHPMVRVSWYGAVAFCNWLSQWQGLRPCYDMTQALWPLTVAPPTPGGYRLPTEAEWERAAAWDNDKHWIYCFQSDTNPRDMANRCNDRNDGAIYDNPLGLTTMPYTSPVGWFDGVNVNPNGNVVTLDSPSPVGAHDLSGNVWEWCNEWYSPTYYMEGLALRSNPTGPSKGAYRVIRGGGWNFIFTRCRSAQRNYITPLSAYFALGFRLSMSP